MRPGDATSLSASFGEMFQRHVQRDNAKHDLDAVFNDVIKALEEQFHVEWMDENDRRAARTRLSQYRVSLPDYQSLDLTDLQFQKSEDYWRRLEIALKYRSHQQFEALRGNDFGQDADGLDAFEVRAALSPASKWSWLDGVCCRLHTTITTTQSL